MTVRYAKGKLAFGFCDTCGQRYDLKYLNVQIVAGRQTNVKNCPYCLDKDHPQYFVGRVPVNDPQALLNPRPDTAQVESRELWGWNPVGNPAVVATGQVGIISFVINGIKSQATYSGEF
jgi:hypothetical protein